MANVIARALCLSLLWLAARLLCSAVLVAALTGCGKADTAPAPHPARPPFTLPAPTHGTSMLPTFIDGEHVRAEFVPLAQCAAGDTVIRWDERARGYNHHRLVRRRSDGSWITKGDNNPGEDIDPMAPDEFVARTKKLFGP